jgi:hypothetical protein
VKKVIFAIIIILAMAGQAMAAWTLTPSIVSKTSHYLLWKVVCVSDGNSLTATDLVALMSDRMKWLVMGSTQMVMTVSPGKAGVIPNTTIDVTLSNEQGIAIFTHATISKDADTHILLAEDFTTYPTVFGKYYLTLNDIGDAADQVTLYFFCWME